MSVTIETFNNGLKQLDELVAKSFSKIEELQTFNKGQQAAIDALKAPFANLPWSVDITSQIKPLQDVINANNQTIAQLQAAIKEAETVSRPKLLADRKAFLDQIAANKERQRRLDEMKKNGEKTNGSGSGGTSGGGQSSSATGSGGLQWWAWLLIGVVVLIVLIIVFSLIARSMKKKSDAANDMNNNFYDESRSPPPAFV